MKTQFLECSEGDKKTPLVRGVFVGLDKHLLQVICQTDMQIGAGSYNRMKVSPAKTLTSKIQGAKCQSLT